MLYLEDYLEMIEQLPMDLRERFTEMREMDLQVQNTMDNLDDKVKKFFDGAAGSKLKPEAKQQQYEQIQKEYYKVLEDADEKVQLANQIYDSVERYLRKLDQEVNKFKMELEADHAGITAILERRSLDLDRPPKMVASTKAEKRKHPTENNSSDKRVHTERLLSNVASEAAQEIAGIKSTGNTVSGSSSNSTNEGSTALSYTLGHVGAGSNAIAMAAARAVTNTLQMQQGRRTASMKASFEAVKATGVSGLTSLSREFTFGSINNSSNKESGSGSNSSGRSRSRKHGSSRSSGASSSSTAATIPTPAPPVEESTPEVVSEDVAAGADWTYDPNEPRYCLCNQVSYGNMVGCDNHNCPIEWFHYGCVGITQPPKGKWFCPQCAASMKRREKKDNPHKHKDKSK